jgi:hypothetical protein
MFGKQNDEGGFFKEQAVRSESQWSMEDERHPHAFQLYG